VPPVSVSNAEPPIAVFWLAVPTLSKELTPNAVLLLPEPDPFIDWNPTAVLLLPPFKNVRDPHPKPVFPLSELLVFKVKYPIATLLLPVVKAVIQSRPKPVLLVPEIVAFPAPSPIIVLPLPSVTFNVDTLPDALNKTDDPQFSAELSAKIVTTAPVTDPISPSIVVMPVLLPPVNLFGPDCEITHLSICHNMHLNKYFQYQMLL
jgi:hypothetical protein